MSCKTQADCRETWIEGIGSNKGIVWSGSALMVGGWYWFLCTSESGGSTYLNPNFNSCYFVATSIEDTYSAAIKIYPNPAKEYVCFEFAAGQQLHSKQLTICKGQGATLKTPILHSSSGKLIWDTRHIQPGIYFYTLRVNDFSKSGKLKISR